jgi:AcrR family transcriptional regulator
VSPRPRKVTDEEIFAAAHRAMQRLGPGELTLAEIAGEAGVTAGALVQRFGSKRELLLKLAEGAGQYAGELIRQLRSRHRSPVATLRAYAECMAELAASPAVLARNLAYLQIDLADPDFRGHLVVQARGTRAGLQSLIAEAVRVGELVDTTKPAVLARTLEAILSGSLLNWGFYREGPAKKWMVGDLDAVLAPYFAEQRRRR